MFQNLPKKCLIGNPVRWIHFVQLTITNKCRQHPSPNRMPNCLNFWSIHFLTTRIAVYSLLTIILMNKLQRGPANKRCLRDLECLNRILTQIFIDHRQVQTFKIRDCHNLTKRFRRRISETEVQLFIPTTDLIIRSKVQPTFLKLTEPTTNLISPFFIDNFKRIDTLKNRWCRLPHRVHR